MDREVIAQFVADRDSMQATISRLTEERDGLNERLIFAEIARDNLIAERDGLQSTVDVLETNASAQAKLLADTGREREGLRTALEGAKRFAERVHELSGERGYLSGTALAQELCRRELDAIDAALAIPPDTDAPVSSIDHHQRRGRHADIIQEALSAYDEWMKDDDFDATKKLRDIIWQMRCRFIDEPTLPDTDAKS